jgi:flagellar biosynthesis/type III secretory pathway M-ring protein FliF/YscJ
LEIQALLSRYGIHLVQDKEFNLLFPEDTTVEQRDTALIALAQTGLIDKNVGLEALDKGDLTASREEKRIKLIRAQQSELARMIRRIGNGKITDATVDISIPEQTLFRSEEKPISAAVQVSLIDPGTMLNRDEVRAVTNLMVGGIQGLDASKVSITDTNGHTYNSVLDINSELNDRLEERDNYMKQKVATQLDRLVGTGNYVVTVSTFLRQAPKETMVQEFDPQGGVVSSKQAFNENLNTNGGPAAGGPTSNFLPNALNSVVNGGTPGKDYLRNGVEVSYNNSKTQWMETRPVGMIEDISVAVTIDSDHFPNMSVNDLQSLLAAAASPKVRPENVSIARSGVSKVEPLIHTEAPPEAKQDMGWLIWAGGAVLACILVILILSMMPKGSNKQMDEGFAQTQHELAQLRDLTLQQQAQIQATQQQTQMLLESQQRQMQQAQALEESVTGQDKRIAGVGGSAIQQTLDELKEVVSSEDLEEDNLSLQNKSWIESS